jgi:hypothetical protein
VNQIGAPAATPITLSGSLRRSPAGGEVNGYRNFHLSLTLLFQTFDMNRNSLSASIGWRSGKKITILPKALIPLCYIDLLEQQG